MNVQIASFADQYFQEHFGKSLSDLSRPFDENMPCGPDLRSNGLYLEIAEARRADDPNLPQGDWAKDLKHSDWKRVTELTLGALSGKSKDLQLSAWLLEAEIRQRGFAALGPCLELISVLVKDYWDDLNPPLEESERRYNIFRWIEDKLPHAVNQVAIAVSVDDSEQFSGRDLDRAVENQRLLDAKLVKEDALDELRPRVVEDLIARTASEFYVNARDDLIQGLKALTSLDERLTEILGVSEAPGFSELRAQLETTLSLVEAELDKRGLLKGLKSERLVSTEDPLDENAGETEAELPDDSLANLSGRDAAYEQLAHIAHYLATIEPHSPVPYLVMRAVEWGSYNTAELYQDLFLINKGQIDLFEVMGIAGQQEDSSAGG